MKTFSAFWGEGYCVETTEEHSLDWFDESRGYELEQSYILDALRVGEVADFSCITGTHRVTRIK